MANHNHPNKTTSLDIEKTIPIVVSSSKDEEDEILLYDECDSHQLINVLEIPNYLSLTTNKSFEKMIQENISRSSTSSINIEALGHITILIHQLNIIDLEKSLWTIYSKSGTTDILKTNESTLKIWPACVKSMIQSSKRITTISDINQIEINDNIYFKFVTEHLCDLNKKQQQLQQQLFQKKKEFHGYTNRIEDILQTFIQQHLQSLRLQYQYKIKLVELDYSECVLEHEFLQQNPTEQQKQITKHLLYQKYDHEQARQEVLLLKQLVLHNKLPKSLDSIEIPLPSSIQSLTDMNQRQHLQDRHHHIMKQYKSEMMKIYPEIVEVKLQESEKLFDDEMANFWQGQRSLPTNQRLNKMMINLMDRHLTLIISKVECIYNYKTLQQLHNKFPTIIP